MLISVHSCMRRYSRMRLVSVATGKHVGNTHRYGFYAELASDVRCRFGDHLRGSERWGRGTILNSTHMICTSTSVDASDPPGVEATSDGDWTVQLRVSLNGQDYSSRAVPFFYYRHPRLTHTSSPSSLAAQQHWLARREFPYGGPVTGGTLTLIHAVPGKGSFEAARLGEAVCCFGDISVPATFVSRYQLLCMSPAFVTVTRAQTVPVSVKLNGLSPPPTDTSYHAAFVAYWAPTIDRVVASAVPRRASVVIRVYGTNLDVFSWFPRCEFGNHSSFGVEQTGAHVVNGSLAICRTPLVNKTARVDFRYLPNAQDAAIDLSWNQTSASDTCGGMACVANRRSAEVTADSVSHGLLRQTPATGPYGTRRRLSITFFPHPAVLEMSLYGGPAKGGTTIDIIGRGFNNSPATSPAVRFHCRADLNSSFASLQEASRQLSPFYGVVDGPVSNPNVVPATVLTPGLLRCLTPPVQCRGPFEVSVALNGYDFHSDVRGFGGSAALPLEFYASPVLESFLPLGGPITGNTSLTVRGKGLRAYSENPKCRFGPATDQSDSPVVQETPGMAIDDETFVCRAPGQAKPVLVRVSVSLNGFDFEPVGSTPFTYYRTPVVSLLEPAGGPSVGGTHVLVRGSGFLKFPLGGHRLFCKFGQTVVPAVNSTNAALAWATTDSTSRCVAPENSAGTVAVTISLNGQDFGSQVFFHYYTLPTLTRTVPQGGPPSREHDSSTKVHVHGTGFLGFHGETLCRFGCALSAAVVIDDTHLECRAPWPLESYQIFDEDCSAQTKRMQCETSLCTLRGCRPRSVDKTLNISCVLDTWLEVSLNGVDFTADSNINYRYYREPEYERFGPTGGPKSGNTLIEIRTGSLGGFQRLNDGSLTINVGGRTVVCEEELGEVVLSDDFDPLPSELLPTDEQQSLVNNYSTTLADVVRENLQAYAFDLNSWDKGEGLTSGKSCGGAAQKDLVTAVIDPGNVQGFGATLMNVTEASRSLHFTGKTSNVLVGRHALSRSVDLSRGALLEMSVLRGHQAWPGPCEAPDAGDDLHLLYRTEAGVQGLAVPRWHERQLWSTVAEFRADDPALDPQVPGPYVGKQNTNATREFLPVTKRLNASRNLLGRPRPLQKMIDCQRDRVCNSSLSRLLLLQINHGNGPYDVWAVDNVKVTSNGGVSSDHRAVCRVPPASAGVSTADFSIALNGQQFTGARASQFLYYEEPEIVSIHPSGGPDGGGTVITLFGSGFDNYADSRHPPKCRFGVQTTAAVVVSDSQVECQGVKDTVYTGFAAVALSLNGVDFTPGPMQYIYYFQPPVLSLYPDSGPARGGTRMHIIGDGFIFLTPFPPSCKFTCIHDRGKSIVMPARYLNNTLLVCTTPNVSAWFADSEMSVDAIVEISLNAQQFTELEALVFTFYVDPTITRAEQSKRGNNVVINGGEPVTVYGRKLRKDADLKCVHRTSSSVCEQTRCTDGVFVSSLYARSEKMYCAAPDFPADIPVQPGLGSTESRMRLAVNGFDVGADEVVLRYFTPLDTSAQVRYALIGVSALLVLLLCCFTQYKRRAAKNRKMVKINEEWKRPSIDVADAHRHDVCIRKYGTRKYDWRRTPCDQLGELGEGIGLYFQFLKYFGQTFCIMAVLAVPGMVLNTSGVAYSSQNINAGAILPGTIGNIGGSADGSENLVILRWDVFSLYLSVPKALVSLICAALDTGIIFVFWLGYLNWQRFQDKVIEASDHDTLQHSVSVCMRTNV